MISKLFIKRPKLAIVISLVMILAGCMAIPNLPIAEYPEITPPQVVARLVYPGASSEDIANTVAAPIETQMNGLEHLLYYTSKSSNVGTYELTITFQYGTDSDIAQVNVQNAIKRAEALLPTEVLQQGVLIYKRSSDMLGVFSFQPKKDSGYTAFDVSNYVKLNVLDYISRVDGVATAVMFSENYYSMRVWLDPLKMSAMGISAVEVSSAIQGQNVQAAAGSVGIEQSNDLMQYKINVKGRLTTPEEFGEIIVRSDGQGSIVKLNDIARIELASNSYANTSCSNGQESVAVALYQNIGSNALQAMTDVQAELKRLEKSFPDWITYQIMFDPTEFITISLKEIVRTLIEALVLVIIVTYLFLQDWRATLIPAIAIPVSLMATFPFLLMFNMSINTLTMFGLILVIGSLVDDAIIVVENVMTGIEHGLTPAEATDRGMNQITGPVIATTLVTLAIYIPVAFYGGMVGQIYLQFSVAMCIALVMSAINALTLSPALCVMILKPKRKTFLNTLLKPIFDPFDWLIACFRKGFLGVSRILVRHLAIMLVLFGCVLYLNYHWFITTPGGFLPEEDKGAILCNIELPPGASLARTQAVLDDIYEMFKDDPYVAKVMTVSGFSMMGGAGENNGFAILDLVKWDKRTTYETSVQMISQRAQAAMQSIPDAKIQCFVPPAIQGLGFANGASFMLCATGDQTAADLSQEALNLTMRMNNKAEWPETLFAYSGYNANTPQLELRIDREKAEMMQVPISNIFVTLQSKLASLYINDFNIQGYTFKVKIQSEAQDRSIRDDISNIYIPNSTGTMVPFSALGDIVYTVGPQQVTRFNQLRAAQFTALSVPGAISSTDYIKKIENAELPKDYHVEWVDLSYQERQNENKIVLLLTMALIFGYLFLVAQYESWTTPVPVMLSVSVATLGALMGITLWRQWFPQDNMCMSIYAQLGLIMLVGLASKNAILMVEFSKVEHEEHGIPIREAALSGASQRYRAVLMTAWSFILGVLPLVTASGAGAASRKAIGVPTFCGMLLATVVGIAFIPALYTLCQFVREAVQPGFRRQMAELQEKQRLAQEQQSGK